MNTKRYIDSIGSIESDHLKLLSAETENPSNYDYCINDLGDRVELACEYGGDTIIVPKDKFEPKLYPEFHLGDKVERTDGTRTGIIYKIYRVWHYSGEGDYFAYYLDYGDRRSTRRTRAEELKRIG